MRPTRLAWLLPLLAISTVRAEVLDKEMTVPEIWTWAVVGSLVALLLWHWRWWAGLFPSAIVLVMLFGVWLEIRDPYVGPGIWEESGGRYPVHFYSAAAVAVALHVVGAYLGVRRRRLRRGQKVSGGALRNRSRD